MSAALLEAVVAVMEGPALWAAANAFAFAGSNAYVNTEEAPLGVIGRTKTPVAAVEQEHPPLRLVKLRFVVVC